jgi:hypothetical protein
MYAGLAPGSWKAGRQPDGQFGGRFPNGLAGRKFLTEKVPFGVAFESIK